MYKIPVDEIKTKITASGKLSSEDLDEKIKAKINELSGLISEEGAAHIIANELGVELVDPNKGQMKIKEIYAGMRNISTVGKVVQKYPVNEFSKGDKQGKVCSLILGDETGTIRVVFWNDQVEQLSTVNQNDVLKVQDVYVRENNGRKEIHMGNQGSIDVNPEGVVIEGVRQGNSFERKTIGQLQAGEEGVEVLGTVVQVFDPRFFEVHPETGKRMQPSDVGVTPALSYVLNAVVDDGSGTIRCVFWKNQTNRLLEKEENDMGQFQQNMALFEEIKTDLLGEQFKLMGRVKKNDMFERLELNVQLVQRANPTQEIEKLEKMQEAQAQESADSTESVEPVESVGGTETTKDAQESQEVEEVQGQVPEQ